MSRLLKGYASNYGAAQVQTLRVRRYQRRTLREVEAATKAAKAAEKDAQRKAEEAVRGAADDAKLAEERIRRISDEIRAVGQEPSCRAQLEQTLCVPLH